MQISKSWLNEWVEVEGIASSELSNILTMAGLEVDDVIASESDASSKEDVFVIELTPNRGDCLSVYGVAREIAALKVLSLKKSKSCERISAKSTKSLTVSIEDEPFCPQYLGRVIENIDLSIETPKWMQERLISAGLNPLSLAVDVTNYVMLELGQPMHAFDLDTIQGGVTVRKAKPGETLTLLNEKEVSLEQETVVIADSSNALAIAGVMGGLASSVSNTTRNLFLESAYFSKEKIAGVARRYGLATDSSHRFERGVAPELQVDAIERATELLLSIAGGAAGGITVSQKEALLPSEKMVRFNPKQAKKVLGVLLSENEIIDIFQRLGMRVYSQGEQWEVRVPTFRFDISIEADLIEEIARLYGYNNLPAKPIVGAFHTHYQHEAARDKLSLANSLVALGFSEVITYSFVCPKEQALLYGESEGLRLLNPISSDLSEMRKGLWPGLIKSALFNLNRQETDLQLFEMGLVFDNSHGELIQTPMIGGLLSGENDNGWHGKKPYDFYDLKGCVEALLGKELLSLIEFRDAKHEALHPGQSAEVFLRGESIGLMGALHPKLQEAFSLEHSCFLFELKLPSILEGSLPKFKKISKFPLIRRDLSFIVDKSTKFSDLYQAINGIEQSEPFFQDCQIFDVYCGKGIPEGKKSIAIGLILQHPSRTLVDEEVNQFIDAILKTLERDFNIILRE